MNGSAQTIGPVKAVALCIIVPNVTASVHPIERTDITSTRDRPHSGFSGDWAGGARPDVANQNSISIIDSEKAEDDLDTATFATVGLSQCYPDKVAFNPDEGRINVPTASTRTVLK